MAYTTRSLLLLFIIALAAATDLTPRSKSAPTSGISLDNAKTAAQPSISDELKDRFDSLDLTLKSLCELDDELNGHVPIKARDVMMRFYKHFLIDYLKTPEITAKIELSIRKEGSSSLSPFESLLMPLLDFGPLWKKRMQYWHTLLKGLMSQVRGSKPLAQQYGQTIRTAFDIAALLRPFLESAKPMTVPDTIRGLQILLSNPNDKIEIIEIEPTTEMHIIPSVKKKKAARKIVTEKFWQCSWIRCNLRPIASASIAQVHLCVILQKALGGEQGKRIWKGQSTPKRGQKVILKLQYSGLRGILQNEVERTRELIIASTDRETEGFEEWLSAEHASIYEETDFIREANNLIKGRKSYRGSGLFSIDWIEVPRPYAVYGKDVTTPSILIMEYAGDDARTITETTAYFTMSPNLKEENAIFAKYVAMFGLLQLLMLLEGLFINEDGHTGNILYSVKRRMIIVIDFGMAKAANKEDLNRVRNLVMILLHWANKDKWEIFRNQYRKPESRLTAEAYAVYQWIEEWIQLIHHRQRTLTEFILNISEAYSALGAHNPEGVDPGVQRIRKTMGYCFHLFLPWIVNVSKSGLGSPSDWVKVPSAFAYIVSAFPTSFVARHVTPILSVVWREKSVLLSAVRNGGKTASKVLDQLSGSLDSPKPQLMSIDQQSHISEKTLEAFRTEVKRALDPRPLWRMKRSYAVGAAALGASVTAGVYASKHTNFTTKANKPKVQRHSIPPTKILKV